VLTVNINLLKNIFIYYFPYAAVCGDAGRGAGAAHGGDASPQGDAVPPGGTLRGAAVHLHAGHLPAAPLLHGRAGPETAGDGPVSGQAGQLRLPSRRGTKGEFT